MTDLTIFQSIFLGLIQGLTEILPISSSAHLFLFPYFFGWEYQGLGFDVALHWGTLLAILVIFWKDYWSYFKAAFSMREEDAFNKKIVWYLVLGSIPAAVLGYLFEEQAETVFRSPLVMVFTLSIFAVLLWVADKKNSKFAHRAQSSQEFSLLSWTKVLFVGFAQAIAIVPGVSRSGATMTAGMFSHLSRSEAARFSFLLAGPIIFGAGLVALQDLSKIDASLVVGFLTAAISGFAAIRFLLKYLVSNNFRIFIFYRFLLALVIVGFLIFG